MARKENFRVRSEEDEAVFRRPLATRIAGAVWGVFIAGFLPATVAFLYSQSHHPDPISLADWFGFCYIEMFCLVLGAIAFSGSGPEDLTLDLRQRTYRFVFGWPFCPQVREGPWEDMAGVYTHQLIYGGAYYVGIAWEGNAMRLPLLWLEGIRPTWLGIFDGFGRWPRSDEFAAEIAALLGLPLVESPFPKARRTR